VEQCDSLFFKYQFGGDLFNMASFLNDAQFKNQRDSSLYKAMGKNQRALPSQPMVRAAPQSEASNDWKRRAELAEEKVRLMEEKIKNLAVAVKSDRDKNRKMIEDLRLQAEGSDAKALAFETKLLEAVSLLKKERSKTLSSQSELKAMMDDMVKQRNQEQNDVRVTKMRDELMKERDINAQQKTEIQYLTLQLEELKQKATAVLKQSQAQSPPPQQQQPQQPPPKRNVLVALFDSPASQSSDNLEFGEGEVFYLVKKFGQDWWLAEKNGKSGKVPREYVEELDIANRSTVRAMGEFRAENKKDLSFSAGDLMLVWITQDDWWVGENPKGELGWAPSNYFEEV